MGFIASAISAVVGFIGSFSIGGFQIGRALLGIGLSLGLSALSKLLGSKQQAKPSGVQLNLQVGADVGRQVVFGRISTKGHLAFFNTSRKENQRFDAVYVLSEGWCDGLEFVWIGGNKKALTQIADDGQGMKTFRIQDYGGLATVFFHDGRPGQSYDVDLITNSSNRYTSQDRFAGMCYVHVVLIYNEDQFPGGPPEFSWQMRGYRCYDVRKDSTIGGAGTHRVDDPTTWEFSENPAVQAYNFLMGIQAENSVVLGPDVPNYDLLGPMFMLAANVCDETVVLEGGGSERRYRSAYIVVGEDSDFRSLLSPIIQAMAGYLLEFQGQFGILAGASQTPVVTVTDGDFRVGPEQRFSMKLSRTERTNEVYGQFVDPEAGYQANSYPPIISADALAEDGEPLRVPLDLAAVPSVTQAQRIARARLRETRAQANGTFTLGYHLMFLDPGDWIRWQSNRYGWTKLFRVMTRQLNSDDSVTIALREVNNGIYDWGTGDEQPVTPPGIPPGDPGYMTTVANFSAEAIMITATNGGERPAVKLTWAPVDDDTVDAVIIEYRRINTIAATRLRDDSPKDGQYIFDTVGSGDQFEFRATIATTPVRPTTWTLWVGVQTGQATIPPGSIDFDALTQAVRDKFKPIPIRYLALDAIQDAKFTWEQETKNRVADVLTSASFTTQIRLQVSATEALATRLDILQAQVGDDIQSQIAEEAIARANADGALASQINTVSTTVNGHSAAIQTNATAVADINGKLSATYTITTDVNGHVSGIRLYNDGTTSDFSILADQVNITALSDFNVSTGSLNVSGDLNVGNVIFIRAGSNPRIEIYDAS
jgi:hypothetical protein